MKIMTFAQIAQEYKIPIDALVSRYQRSDIVCVKIRGKNWFNERQILQLVKKEHYALSVGYKKQLMIWQYKLENPTLSNEEIASVLCANQTTVNLSLRFDYFIIESKMNK